MNERILLSRVTTSVESLFYHFHNFKALCTLCNCADVHIQSNTVKGEFGIIVLSNSCFHNINHTGTVTVIHVPWYLNLNLFNKTYCLKATQKFIFPTTSFRSQIHMTSQKAISTISTTFQKQIIFFSSFPPFLFLFLCSLGCTIICSVDQAGLNSDMPLSPE